jgi:D-glycero-D-manno-heptose 1,7-bisphosphate phosphatase
VQQVIFLEVLRSEAYTFRVVSRPAVFIDRDGTLTEEVGYVNHPSRLRLLPRSAQAIRRLNEAGVAAVLATNQAGIARGYFSEDVLHAVNDALVSQLKDAGAHLDGIYVCPHHPLEGQPPFRAECDCRKPQPGLLLRAAAELHLDLGASTMVGDKPSDLVPARAVGARGVLVLTGYGRGEWEYRREHFPFAPDFVAADLLDAVEWVLGERPA